ncbi:TolC family protein [Clostridium chromiireducens]|uniref:TolC family protein n=1 Tax=Clostridium chromiireducens TaxID=225345 RepID=UPI003AF946D1
MSKKIKKVLIIGIVLSIINSSALPAFAVEDKEKLTKVQTTLVNEKIVDISTKTQNLQITEVRKILTLDKAIEAAISNSDKLKLKSKEIKMYQDKIDLQEKNNDYYKSIGQKVYDFPYDKLELQEKQTKESKEFMEDQIANDITNKYNDMILKEIDINKSKRYLELKKKDFDFIKGKLSLEMATPTEVKDAEIELKSLENDIKAKENLLNDNKEYFKVLTDLDIKNTYKLDDSMKYEKFKISGSMDEYIDDKIDKYLKYDTEILKLTKDYMKDLKDDGIKDIMKKDTEKLPDKALSITAKEDGTYEFDSGSYALKLIEYQQKQMEYLAKLNAYGEYIGGDYNVSEAKVKLEESKRNLKNGLKEGYSTLLDLENKIDALKEQVNSTNTKLSFGKAQVDMGLMLQNDYDKQVLESEDLDTGIRKLVYTYNNLKDSIQKPWILSNN